MATIDPTTISTLGNVRERIVGIDQRVPVLDGSMRSYVNFDNAASTPVLRDVLDTVNDFMRWYSSVHRGTGFKSRVATQAYDDAREIVAEFVGANLRDHTVIFGKNTSEAVNKLSYRLPLQPDDVVLVSLLEHHSNDLPWRHRCQVEHIGADRLGRLDEDDLVRLLDKYKGRVKLVAVTGAANVTGHLPNIHRIAQKAHEAGAQVMIDCAQLAPHRTVNMGDLADPEHLDYVAISAHKMYAPFGTGALIGLRSTFEQGEPEYRGGGTIDFVTRDTVDWAGPPDRDEAGSPNVVGAVALAATIKALHNIGMDAIAQHEAELTTYTLERMQGLDEVRIFGDSSPANTSMRLGVVPFQVHDLSHFLVAAILGTEYGIGVRNGCFCAHPYLLHLMGADDAEIRVIRDNIVIHRKGEMPGMVRASFGMYNTPEEVDVLIQALRDIAAGQYRGEYAQNVTSGEYHAKGWDPDLTPYFKL
jgi:cysteine desulfurase / selenocysteine lyase